MFTSIIHYQKQKSQFMKNQFHADVIIVGGGAAGIGAAYHLLTQSSKTWKLLEARNNMCGRIQKRVIDGKDVDIGAYEFAGFQQNSELIDLVKSGWCKIEARQHLDRIVYIDEQEGEFTKQQVKVLDELMEKLKKFTIKTVVQEGNKNLTMLQAIQSFKQKDPSFSSQPPKIQRLFYLNINMIEHEQASDMHKLPALEALTIAQGMEEDELDIQPIPIQTYSNVMMKFVQQFPTDNVHCNTQVVSIKKISHQKVQVIAKMHKGTEYQQQIFECKKVICAVPLSVLKGGKILFEPPLPEFYAQSLQKLEAGVMQKIILGFEKPFWTQNTQRIKISGHQHGIFPHFINISGPKNNQTENAYILVGFMTSEPAIKMWRQFSKEQIIDKCIQMFKKIFPKQDIVLKDWFITDWGQTQFINQSFSSFGIDATVQMTKKMRAGIDDYLWLAGEYLFGQNMGCAHGAFALGSRAAKDILQGNQQCI